MKCKLFFMIGLPMCLLWFIILVLLHNNPLQKYWVFVFIPLCILAFRLGVEDARNDAHNHGFPLFKEKEVKNDNKRV